MGTFGSLCHVGLFDETPNVVDWLRDCVWPILFNAELVSEKGQVLSELVSVL